MLQTLRSWAAFAAVAAVGLVSQQQAGAADGFEIVGDRGTQLAARVVAEFDEPWAMAFLPDGGILVTTKPGRLFLVAQDGGKQEVEGLWEVAYGGQGGLGDVVLHPDFAETRWLYISSVESRDGGATRGAVVKRARLVGAAEGFRLDSIETIWTQEPKVSGKGHFSHRLAFGPDGLLYITSGERQKMTPAQDFDTALGKIIRLNDDGSVPRDNPWQDKGDLAKTFWTMGHRNMLGIAFDGEGRLWAHEMGPRHGDELNLIFKGGNYGWPLVSNGDHYSGEKIPDHDTRPDFNAPKAYWVPAISPAGLVIYDGDAFPAWRGDALLGGLSSEALIRVQFDGESAREAERFEWGKRVREVEQGPAGSLWVLEDRSGGRLLELMPKG
jgi:glucose/arabinose dehydrogenase